MGFFNQFWIFFRTRYVTWAVLVAWAGFSAVIGLRLTPWLAYKLGVQLPRYAVLESPSPDYVDGLVKMLNSAQVEIVIAAPRIDAVGLLEVLRERQTKGLPVTIVLSPDQVARDTGCLGWLLHFGVRQVYIDKFPFTGTLLIIDGKMAVISTLPITTHTKLAGVGGPSLFIRHDQAAADLRNDVLRQAARGTPAHS